MTDPITITDALLDRIHLLPEHQIGLPQWGVGRNEAGSKIPYLAGNPKRRARVNAPDEWGTFAEAVDTFANWLGRDDQFNWLAFLFTADDGLVGVDLDDAVTGDVIHPEARKVVDALGGYAEISPSGTGIKLWTRAHLNITNSGMKRKGPWGGDIEVYHDRRWFALTGWRLDQ